MSAWLWATTADVGMRVFANSFPSLLTEAANGMQNYLMSESSARRINSVVRNTGEWRVRSNHRAADAEFLYMAWLDEILYRAEVKRQWYVDGMVKITTDDEGGLTAVAQVSYVNTDEIEREIEIKAVTTHRLVVGEVQAGQTLSSPWDDVPAFDGPGWYADVVFDI